jgi:DNA polymerase III alpha subunit
MENKQEIIPIWYSDSSGRGINVWWPKKETKSDGPQSIITLAKKAGLKEVYFVSTRMYDFVSALKLCDENNLQLIFGLELWVCSNAEEHTPESVNDESKVIVWMRNSQSYKDIIKLYSKVFTNPKGKYYHYRTSWSVLGEMWTENLSLSVPYFDSFLHRNTLNYGSAIIPKFPVKPVFMKEINSGLPFAPLIDEALDNFIKDGEYEVINTKTIYYPDYEDAKSWLIFRAIKERTTFQKPELNHCGSPNFCLTDYLNLTEVKA